MANTCPFDSLSQLLAVSIVDSDITNLLLESVEWFRFIKTFVEKGVTANTYKVRGNLLMKFSKKVLLPQNIVQLDAETFITNVINNLLPDNIDYIFNCNNCRNKEIHKAKFMSIEINNSNLLDLENVFINKLLQNESNKMCLCKNKYQLTTIINSYLFIEPINTEVLKLNFIIKLENLPFYIKALNKKLLLRGVVGHFSGHFIAFCRRHTGVWEEYNDLNDKKAIISPKREVEVVILLYTE